MPADLATGIEDRRSAIAPLPSNVHYVCIKRFLLELPSPMTTLALMAAPTAHDAAWRALAGKTFRTVDRLLRQREAELAQRPIDESEARRTVTALRGQWIHHLLAELLWHTTGRLWVATRLTRGRGPKLSMRLVAHVEVWTLKGKGPQLLERRTIAPTVKHWAGASVDHFDLDAVHLALSEVLRTYARDLFGRRCGTRWRSRRRPAGWPLVTRHAIPWLYDYLRPFYVVRPYRHRRQWASAGNYPATLRRDIRDILRFERPDLARDLTVGHITAAIQYHLRTAPPNRPMGEKLCAQLQRSKTRNTR